MKIIPENTKKYTIYFIVIEVFTFLFFALPCFNVYAQSIFSNMLISDTKENEISILKIDCNSADFEVLEIKCSAFTFSFESTNTDSSIDPSDLEKWYADFSGEWSTFCSENNSKYLRQHIDIYLHRTFGKFIGGPIIIAGNKGIFSFFEKLNTPIGKFLKIDQQEWTSLQKNKLFYCANNGFEFEKFFRHKIDYMSELAKSYLSFSTVDAVSETTYKKDIGTGNFYFERDILDACAIFVERHEIILEPKSYPGGHDVIYDNEKAYIDAYEIIAYIREKKFKNIRNKIEQYLECEKINILKYKKDIEYREEWKFKYFISFSKMIKGIIF